MTKLMDLIRNPDFGKTDRCLIWPKHMATVHKEGRLRIVKGSDRVGTSYSIAKPTESALNSKIKNDRDRAKLTTLLLNLNQQGVDVPEVTSELISRALAAPPLSVAERANRMLVLIGTECDTIDDVYFTSIKHLLEREMAWTESTTDGELRYIWDYLMEMGWIKPARDPNVHPNENCIITPAGHARIAELSTRTDSAQAFVARWFNDSVKIAYKDAIAPAIKAAGYDHRPIEEADSLDPITDQIIAEIRRSRFVVADFTHGCDGARGSVYYEAGFAHGLNIPVIFTAQEGTKPHFDTSTYPHICWSPNDLPAFRTALTNRILALKELGPGPRLP